MEVRYEPCLGVAGLLREGVCGKPVQGIRWFMCASCVCLKPSAHAKDPRPDRLL